MTRALALLLAVLVVLLAGTSAAHAAVPGVNVGTTKMPGGLLQTPDIDDAVATGARSVRLFVDWHLAEPAPGAYREPGPATRLRTLKTVVDYSRSKGLTPVLVVFGTPEWARAPELRDQHNAPPADPASYASFMGYLAGLLGSDVRPHPVYEIWNEQDMGEFWHGGPQPVQYAALLKASKAAIDAADPHAEVLFGALTGNNYTFFEQAWDQGGLDAGSFDGLALHTDTACLVNPPDFYVRNIGEALDGRINRFSFLGFREVRASMLARGADKPIWMTELGWSSYEGLCEKPGVEAGRKGGVSQQQQADFTRRAYECLANYDYVTHAQLFDLRDRSATRSGLYGMLDGETRKPVWHAFRAVASAPPAPGIACGDFTPPTVTEQIPLKTVTGKMRLRAQATDPSGVTRISFKVDGQLIRHFSASAGHLQGGVAEMDWFGATNLAPGPHTLRIEALDQPANVGVTEVRIVKLDPSTITTKLKAAIELRTLKVRKGRATLVGVVRKTDPIGLKGNVRVAWEALRPVKVGRGKARRTVQRWKKIHGGAKFVSILDRGSYDRFSFTQKLKYSRYRVRVTYVSKPGFPYVAPATKAYAVKTTTFKVAKGR